MTTYTNRPADKFCTKSSPEIHEIVKDFCERHGIPIYGDTKNRGYNDLQPYLVWDGDEVVGISWKIDETVLFHEFLANFRTVEVEPRSEQSERGAELMKLADTLQEGIDKLRKLITAKQR